MPEYNEVTQPDAGQHVADDADRAGRAEFERLYQERSDNIRTNMGRLYDRALEKHMRPINLMLEENGERSFAEAEFIFGSERTEQIKRAFQELQYADRDDFIEKMATLAEPFTRDRYFDPEVRARAEEIERRHQPETFEAGILNGSMIPSQWSFALSDGTDVQLGDRVMELSLPEERVAERGLGPQGLREALQRVAVRLKQDESIKAVVGVSWMMSHDLTTRLGFEKFPDVQVPDDQRASVFDIATKARGGKPYAWEVSHEDVKLGAMSRDAFLERYG